MSHQLTSSKSNACARACRSLRLRALVAAALALAACAPFAWAQTQTNSAAKGGAVEQRKAGQTVEKKVSEPRASGGEAVRKRRATAGTSAKVEPPTKSEPGTKDEPPAKSESATKEKTTKEERTTEGDGVSEAAADEDAKPVEAGTDVDALAARLASEHNPSERARLQRSLVERLAASGRSPQSVEILRGMLAEERFDPPFFYNMGNALARLGESDAAVEAYRKAITQRQGNYARAQHNLGVVLMRLGRWEDAEDALKAALRLENFRYAEASYSLGRLHALRGEAGLAIAEWGRTLKLKPDHADAAVALARALAEDGDPERALAVLDAFNERMGRRGASAPREVAVARGEIVATANVSTEERHTKSSFEERGAKSPGGDERTTIAASITRAPRESDSAIVREARKPIAARLRPLAVDKQTYDLLRRARTARQQSRDEEAVTLYRRAIESNGGYFPPANLELGYTLSGLRRNEEAVESLLLVIKHEGARYPVAFYHLGRFYEHMGRLAEAGDAFARSAALMGDQSPQFFIDLSRVREREGKYAEALTAAEEYVRATERLGSTPDWARARVSKLRKQAEAVPATPTKQ
jgi:tetratricopeptide (TPR) repeat protein